MMQFFESMRPWRHAAEFLRPALVVIGHGGCASPKAEGPRICHPVPGTVTMDGEPLQKVLVTFLAEKEVVTSGVTDAAGRYTLLYRGIHRGAGMGRNTVQVTTPPDDPDRGLAKEPIPAVYNIRYTLTADVVAGPNTFNFTLVSKPSGKIP